MFKKAFTLIELLAVIIILAIVALIATPIILNVIDDARISAGNSETQIIYSGINAYCSVSAIENQLNGSVDICADGVTIEEVSQMVNLGNANVTSVSYDGSKITNLVVESNNHIFTLCDDGTFVMDDEECSVVQPDYVDNSGANAPELATNMIPVKYDGTNWVYANIKEEWYDYNSKEWANAVVLNNNVTKNVGDTISEEEIALWYVWIPRYKYQLFNANNGSVAEQLINIEFESGMATTGTVSCTDAINQTDDDGNLISEVCTNAENGNWYTHPAFSFGDEELTGFWIGKFEVSGTTDEITIKPNVSALRDTTLSVFFTAIQNMSTTYNLDADSHVIKNMEWGAVVYLSHSNYGIGEEIYINNSSGYYTGRSGGEVGGYNLTEAEQFPNESTSSNLYSTNGYYTYDGKVVNYDGSIGDYASDRSLGTKASTTGNIYGVYDMSGGAWEGVMGNMVDSSGSFYSSSAGFESAPEDKYYDKYTYDDALSSHSRGKLGDATKETLSTFGISTGSWYSDYSDFVYSSTPWFARGSRYYRSFNSGAFNFGRFNGNVSSSLSVRAVLVG